LQLQLQCYNYTACRAHRATRLERRGGRPGHDDALHPLQELLAGRALHARPVDLRAIYRSGSPRTRGLSHTIRSLIVRGLTRPLGVACTSIGETGGFDQFAAMSKTYAPSHGRHCHSTLSLTVIGYHSLGIYILILLSLAVEMTVPPMAKRADGREEDPCEVGVPRVAAARHHGAHLGSGRVVASETEAPSVFANLAWSG
jgi:hypothetical protein